MCACTDGCTHIDCAMVKNYIDNDAHLEPMGPIYLWGTREQEDLRNTIKVRGSGQTAFELLISKGVLDHGGKQR